jgi:hypothetical protein
MPTRLLSPRQAVPTRVAGREIDNFGAWISFLVVFASVMAVLVVWQNYNDHAYSLAKGGHPHLVTTALAKK